MFKKKPKQELPQAAKEMEPLQGKDEALFEALGKNQKAKKRRLVRTIVIAVAVVAIILTVVVFVMQRRVREQFAATADTVITAQAERGTISTVVSGSGMLLNVDTEVISVPSGVEVTEILVEFGDTVESGALLAVVDMATVRTAMSTLQSEIEELDDEISDAEGDTVSSYITAGVPGRVKALYAEKGALVEDVMVDYGGLAILSLDGYMAVELETDALSEGENVTVLLSDGETKTGTVDTLVGNTATVLVTDNGPEYLEEVTVVKADGTEAGSGKLTIHNPLMVTGYAGTVKTINVKLNQKVSSGTTLFTLKDTASSASYDALLRTRREKEETLLELLKLQRYGGLTAPISGSVYSVADLDSDAMVTDIVTLSPDISMSVTISVDESDILSLELGQSADVTVSAVSDEPLTGTVTQIDKTDSSGAYTAEIILNKVAGMLPGMTASVDVRIEGVDDAILIPVDALHQTSSGYYVYTTYDEQLQEFGGRVDVVPGLSNSNYVQIKSGLQEGDTVCYTEEQDMFSGMGFGNMGNLGGQMPGQNRENGGSQMPSFGGNDGGGMPGGQMPGRG